RGPAELAGANTSGTEARQSEPQLGEREPDDPPAASSVAMETAPTDEVVVVAPPPIQDPFFNPWAEFGARIAYDSETQFVTKPYPLRRGMGVKIIELVQDYGDFRLHDPEQGPQQAEELDLANWPDFDVEAMAENLRDPQKSTGKPIKVA